MPRVSGTFSQSPKVFDIAFLPCFHLFRSGRLGLLSFVFLLSMSLSQGGLAVCTEKYNDKLDTCFHTCPEFQGLTHAT